jgi:hypothetical protein
VAREVCSMFIVVLLTLCVGVNCNVAFVVHGDRVWPDCSAIDTLQYSGGQHLGC